VRHKGWTSLAPAEGDDVIMTPNKAIKVPRVIISVNYAKVPKKRPQLNMPNLARHYNNTCAITGRKLSRQEMSKEHVVPLSKGGDTSWANCVLADRKVNSLRGNKTYKEAGLKPPVVKPAPKEVPVSITIRNQFELKEWDLFLGR